MRSYVMSGGNLYNPGASWKVRNPGDPTIFAMDKKVPGTLDFMIIGCREDVIYYGLDKNSRGYSRFSLEGRRLKDLTGQELDQISLDTGIPVCELGAVKEVERNHFLGLREPVQLGSCIGVNP